MSELRDKSSSKVAKHACVWRAWLLTDSVIKKKEKRKWKEQCIFGGGFFETKIKKQTTMKINLWLMEKELGECQKQFVE